MRLANFPFVAVAVSLALGIVVADVLSGSMGLSLWLLLLLLAVLVSSFCLRRRLLQTILLFVSVSLLGASLASLRLSKIRRPLPQGFCCYDAIVMSSPEARAKTMAVDLRIVDGEMDGRRVRAWFRKDSMGRSAALQAGDGVSVCSELMVPKDFGNRRGYARWMEAHGYEAQTFVGSGQWQKAAVSMRSLSHVEVVRLKALRLRSRLLHEGLGQYVSGDGYAVVAAMALGDKSGLDRELRETFSVAGGSHILALSGLHLGMVYMMLSLVMGHWRRRWAGKTIQMAAIWAFVVLAGMPASLVRAALMLTVYWLAGLSGRQGGGLNSLGVAATVMIVQNPLVLWDVGFQMSVLAVAGILVCYQPLMDFVNRKWLSEHPVVGWLWSMAVLSLSAQIGVAPLVMYHFHRFSTYFLLTNMIAVPAATILLQLAMVFFLCWPLKMMQAVLGKLIAYVAGLLGSYMSTISSLPMSSIEGINLTACQTVLIYVLLMVCGGIFYYLRKMHRLSRYTLK